jgi:hypothetical protein
MYHPAMRHVHHREKSHRRVDQSFPKALDLRWNTATPAQLTFSGFCMRAQIRDAVLRAGGERFRPSTPALQRRTRAAG